MASADAKSKEPVTRNFTGKFPLAFGPEFPPIHADTVRAALEHVFFEGEAINAKQVADEIGKSSKTVYAKISGEVTLTIEEFLRIARLALAHGDSSLIDLAIPDGFVIIATDEDCMTLEGAATEILADAGEAIRDAKSGLNSKAEKAARRTITDATRLEKTVRKKV
ncbi:MAG TPA: hypothetical protein VGM92_15530 [Candidatus Kapabacteria bacterium]|jgi:hypothetical protein